MANTQQAKKRVRQQETHRQRNVNLRSKMRTFIKKVIAAIDSGNQEDAKKTFKEAVSVIDSMINKGIVHRNKAARHKKRLHARIKQMEA